MHVSKEGNKVERRAGWRKRKIMLKALERVLGKVPKVSHEERSLTAVRQVKGKKGRRDIRMSARGRFRSIFGALRR